MQNARNRLRIPKSWYNILSCLLKLHRIKAEIHSPCFKYFNDYNYLWAQGATFNCLLAIFSVLGDSSQFTYTFYKGIHTLKHTYVAVASRFTWLRLIPYLIIAYTYLSSFFKTAHDGKYTMHNYMNMINDHRCFYL